VPGRYQFSLPERSSRDGWFRIGNLDVTTTALMVGVAIASMFWYAIDKVSLMKLPFIGVLVRDGDYWRVATWPIANPLDRQGIWIILTLVFFWFLGHRIEDLAGRVRFTWLLVAMTIIPAALVSLLSFDPVYGAYGLRVLSIGMVAIFALEMPNVSFFFGVPAWVMALIYVMLDALYYFSDRAYEVLTLELLVIAVGIVGARQCGLLQELGFIPQVLGKRRAPSSARPAKRRKGSGPTVVAGPWAAEPAHSPLEQAELDMLLDKISSHGLDALSKTEKARLNELSKKLRGR
jgi:membrane associated rhomboid family serine protease